MVIPGFRVPKALVLLICLALPGSLQGQQSVTALDIFLACRHSDAFVPGDPLQQFCSLRLPTGRASVQDVVAEWMAVDAPAPQTLVEYRLNVQARQAERRAAAATANGVRSADIARGEIVFPGEPNVEASMQQILAGPISGELARLRDSLGIAVVEIVGYRVAGETEGLGRRRAEAVGNALFADAPAPARPDTGVAVAPPVRLLDGMTADVAAESVTQDSSFRGRVTIHVQLPRISALNSTVLGAVRFAPGISELDESGRILAGTAAGQLASLPAYRNGAIVEVIGHADRNDTLIAARRAAALKAALVDAGIQSEQILTATSRVPLEQGAATAFQGADRRDWFTIRDDGATSALQSTTAPNSGGGLGLSLGWEAVAQAATDAIVARAERELQQYMLVSFGRRVCAVAKDTLRSTCLALQDSSEERYLPSLGTLRTLVQQDVEWLPERSIAVLLRGMASDRSAVAARIDAIEQRVVQLNDTAPAIVARSDTDTGDAAVRVLSSAELAELEGLRRSLEVLQDTLALHSARESISAPYAAHALVALYIFESTRRVHRGEHPLDALIDFDEWLTAFMERQPEVSYVGTLPAMQSMLQFSRYALATRNAAETLRPIAAGGIPRDTLFRYAALQFLANTPTPGREAVAGRIAQLVEARRDVEHLLSTLESLRQRIEGLQTYGESSREVRRELYASALQNLVEIGLAGFLSGASASDRERLEHLQETLGSLIFAIRTRSYPEVLQRSIALLQDVRPNTGLCLDAACSPRLLNEQVRALALAVDVSEARSQDEMTAAMSRFVDQGGGVAAKRSGRPKLGLHLNSYVGVGAGWREGGEVGFLLRLPIGAEVVVRQSGTPDWAFSTFVQMVDLGGFLPQQGDRSDRSSDERLASVLNPGLFFMMSLGSSPISIGGGMTGDTYVESDSWRVRPRGVFFAGVDVPLLRIR